MKSASLLLLAVFCACVHAQTTPSCGDTLRDVPFHDRACPGPMAAGASNRAAPRKSSPPPPAPANTSTGPHYWQNDRSPPPVQRRLQARIEAQAIAARVQRLQKAENEHRAAGYAENRLRCERAMQVAALCGKFAGTFSCGERGFRPVIAADGVAVKPAVMSNDAKYQMDRCALQASR